MSDVSVQLVRECFELNHFHVMTYWQHDSGRLHPADPGLQLFVENTAPVSGAEADYVLGPGDIAAIQRAVVEVRAWHADRFYVSVIAPNPILFQVAEEDSIARATQVFGGADFKTILVISELPASAELRERSSALFRDAGISHVLEFPVVLQEVLGKLSPYGSYAPSYTLQTLRLLKRYNFVRRQQLEFEFPTEPPPTAEPPRVETAEEPVEEEDESRTAS